MHPIHNCSLPGSLGGGGGGGTGSQEAGTGPHFLLQFFFSYFPPLKPRYILWSGVSHSPKNMVLKYEITVAKGYYNDFRFDLLIC